MRNSALGVHPKYIELTARAQFGYYNIQLILGMAVGAIGSGLLYTMDQSTGQGKWASFQFLVGAGFGAAFQLPFVRHSFARVQPLAEVVADRQSDCLLRHGSRARQLYRHRTPSLRFLPPH